MSATEHTYAVNEIFYSLQGEGYHTGTPVVFVRFAGCNRACGFCDTDFRASTPMTAEAIAAEAQRLAPLCNSIVLTGGEPMLQVDDNLVDTLHAHGYILHIETNGTIPVHPGIDWLTCSPKDPTPVPQPVDELKIVYTGNDMQMEYLYELYGRPVHAFLQPCSGQNTAETIAYILAHPHWRLSLQTHKLTGIR